jgi:hypothetical protein
MILVRIRDLAFPSVSEVLEFDTFVEACDFIKDQLGPTLDKGYVIEIETGEA